MERFFLDKGAQGVGGPYRASVGISSRRGEFDL